MPINIYEAKGYKEVAYLAENEWGLPMQLSILERWLIKVQNELPQGDYVADIGFVTSPEAAGGGGSFSSSSMRIASQLGITIFFSEYPS
ncbi:hypothetical protein [Roseivirga sp.]|uniref:hypothetical protein n=1 Tax=Roseivirga sp. TaxID=1964215 RepID=UPI003B529263